MRVESEMPGTSVEELREVLVDLHWARRHEKRLRLESDALLEGLRALSDARTPNELFGRLVGVLRPLVEFEDAVALMENGAGELTAISSTSETLDGLSWQPEELFARVRGGETVAVFDIGCIPEWRKQPESVQAAFGSAVHTPLRIGSLNAILVFVHHQRSFFDRDHVHLIERFAPLTNQVLASLEHRLELEELALHDSLTGLANRRKFLQRFEEESLRQRRHRRSFAILVVDLDDFKRINDLHGHLAGDECLRQIAAVLTAGVRSVDLVARFGGEEFTVLLSETDSEGASLVAEKIRTTIDRSVFEIKVGDTVHELQMTASLGIRAVRLGERASFDELLESADQAMYRAKREGRNRCRFAAPDLTRDRSFSRLHR